MQSLKLLLGASPTPHLSRSFSTVVWEKERDRWGVGLAPRVYMPPIQEIGRLVISATLVYSYVDESISGMNSA